MYYSSQLVSGHEDRSPFYMSPVLPLCPDYSAYTGRLSIDEGRGACLNTCSRRARSLFGPTVPFVLFSWIIPIRFEYVVDLQWHSVPIVIPA